MTDKQKIREFLASYQLSLDYYLDLGKVKKVFTNNGVFSIKSIPATIGTDFVRNVQLLYQQGYNRIVPIFPTIDGKYGVLQGNQIWYLMPWLPDELSGEHNERHQQMLRELARIHLLSVKEVLVKAADRETHYQRTKERWQKKAEFLEEFVHTAERKWYMSPFELQYCTYHYDISQAINFSVQKLDAWYEQTKSDEKIRYVINHGKISIHHFLYSDNGRGHFINFENTNEAPPYFDILPFFVGQLKTYPKKSDDLLEYFNLYLKFFPWKDGEKLLFSSYLANPGYCVKVVEDYYHNRSSEIEYSKKLQAEYWLLKNTEYLIMRMEERETQQPIGA